MSDLITEAAKKRIKYKRKYTELPLSSIANYMCDIFCNLPDANDIFLNVLSQDIQEILNDCEIYFNMPEDKAMDVLRELSTYATIYAMSYRYRHVYIRVCELIKNICRSYPAPNINWTESTPSYLPE